MLLRMPLLEAVLGWQASDGRPGLNTPRLSNVGRTLLLLLLELLQSLLKLPLLLIGIVGIAGRSAITPPRLGLRLEGFPDD